MKTAKPLKYLVIYGSYQELIVGLFEGPQLIHFSYHENIRLSSHLLGVLEEVLSSGSASLADLACIAVCQGPGSFSSLRALLASLNGIAAASGVPLIGCDGLAAISDILAAAVPLGRPHITLATMNAYNNEVFYFVECVDASGKRSRLVPPGYTVAENLIPSITEFGYFILVAGNSALPFIETLGFLRIKEVVYTPHELVQALAVQARQKWENGESASSLQPSYLKTLQFKKLDR